MLRCFRTQLAWLLPALLLLLASAAPAVGASRLALVVGNAAYPARPLATAANDAALVAQALAQAGFDVTAARDLDAAGLRAAFTAFVGSARAAGPDAVLFVYLSGYGVQYTGGNFFVPVDARLVHDDDVPSETASLDDLVRTLAALPAKARFIVTDASRPQPFATTDEMPLAPGLGLMSAQKDTIVAAAAAPGMVSPEDAVPYGAYARALAETIAAPGLSPNELFERVRLRVGTLTNGEQVPWNDGVADAAVALTPAAAPVGAPAPTAPSLPSAPAAPPSLSPDNAYSVVILRDTLASYAELLRVARDGPIAERIRVLQAIRREAMIWQAAAASDDPRASWTYIRRYPRGPHRFDARRRLATLHAALEPPPRFDAFVFPALPPPNPAELPLVKAPERALRSLPPIPLPPRTMLPPTDPAYYDELPMPAPAPAGLLPVAPPLPGAASGEPGRITQVRPSEVVVVSETQLTPNGSASVTLADTAGPVLSLIAGEATGDLRTLIETGAPPATEPAKATPTKSGPSAAATGTTPKSEADPAVLTRTEIRRTADGVTITQFGADGTSLLEIATRGDADGARVTRVTNDQNELLANWRRTAQGIVTLREVVPSLSATKPEIATVETKRPAPRLDADARSPGPPSIADVPPVAPVAPTVPSSSAPAANPAAPPPTVVPAPAVPSTTAPQLLRMVPTTPTPSPAAAPQSQPPRVLPLTTPTTPETTAPLPPRRPVAAVTTKPAASPRRAPALQRRAPPTLKAPVLSRRAAAGRKPPPPRRTAPPRSIRR